MLSWQDLGWSRRTGSWSLMRRNAGSRSMALSSSGTVRDREGLRAAGAMGRRSFRDCGCTSALRPHVLVARALDGPPWQGPGWPSTRLAARSPATSSAWPDVVGRRCCRPYRLCPIRRLILPTSVPPLLPPPRPRQALPGGAVPSLWPLVLLAGKAAALEVLTLMPRLNGLGGQCCLPVGCWTASVSARSSSRPPATHQLQLALPPRGVAALPELSTPRRYDLHDMGQGRVRKVALTCSARSQSGHS
mmetsp:Transcript_135975/g.290637  ORF Transcript_135975/g.290637 Transcript_135975/m.290637 type:complete len:247 (-) Transcript_135975:27-767(-)